MTPISHTATAEMNRSYEEDQLEDLVVLEDPIFPLKLSSCRVLIPQVSSRVLYLTVDLFVNMLIDTPVQSRGVSFYIVVFHKLP